MDGTFCYTPKENVRLQKYTVTKGTTGKPCTGYNREDGPCDGPLYFVQRASVSRDRSTDDERGIKEPRNVSL